MEIIDFKRPPSPPQLLEHGGVFGAGFELLYMQTHLPIPYPWSKSPTVFKPYSIPLELARLCTTRVSLLPVLYRVKVEETQQVSLTVEFN